MLRMTLRLRYACLIWSAIALTVMAQESESGKPAAIDTAPATDTDQQPVISDVIDTAFDRYVDLALLAPAVEAGDAATLTDLALQTAFGESVLERSHKAVTSKELASLALKVALENKDDKSLDRLGKFAEKSGDGDLKTQITMQRKLASASRAVPAVMVSLDQMSVEGLKDFKDYSTDIELAVRLGDTWKLEQIKEADLSGLPEELQKKIADAIEAAEVKLSQSSDALTKLLGVSRECNRHNPPAGSGGGYGAPAGGAGGYGSLAGGAGYGATTVGAGGYGTPAVSAGGYGTPAVSAGGYGTPAVSAGGYGAPAVSTGGYGAPAVSTGGYGRPAVSAGGYGTPAVNAGGYGPSQSTGGYQGVVPQAFAQLGGVSRSGGYGSPQTPTTGSYGTPQIPTTGGYGTPQTTTTGGYGTPPAPTTGGYGTPGATAGYAPPAEGGYGLLVVNFERGPAYATGSFKGTFEQTGSGAWIERNCQGEYPCQEVSRNGSLIELKRTGDKVDKRYRFDLHKTELVDFTAPNLACRIEPIAPQPWPYTPAIEQPLQ